MSIFYTRHDGGITLFKNGKQSVVSSTHQNFQKILEALQHRDFDKLESLMSIERTINENGYGTHKRKSKSKVFVRNGKVYFLDTRNRKEQELSGTLVDRILRDLGKPGTVKYADALLALMENIQKNKEKDISNELYEWLASGQAPITSDGCILAYKKVRDDFFDIYTGKIDNSPGKIPRMKQSEVDRDRRNECSHGLHFASIGYLSHYASVNNCKIVIVKVNPRHIFAIPRDYQCQKGRASEYYVVGEYKGANNQTKEAFKDAFINEDNLAQSAPDVVFVKDGLYPSLETVAESYGLVRDGLVKVCYNGKERAIVEWDIDESVVLSDPNATIKIMSFATNSVRAAVKATVAAIKKQRR
jgi:hypothetical protein